MTLPPLPPGSADEPIAGAPDWVAAEMPPGYHNRLAEIQRLSDDLRAMDPFGRLLWGAGPGLTEAVRDAFLALKFEATPMPSAAPGLAVKLDAGRLLLHVAPSGAIIKKRSPELAHVFQMLQESAEDGDRVVLVANSRPGAAARRTGPRESSLRRCSSSAGWARISWPRRACSGCGACRSSTRNARAATWDVFMLRTAESSCYRPCDADRTDHRLSQIAFSFLCNPQSCNPAIHQCAMTDVPGRVTRALTRKRWPSAVTSNA